MTSHMIGSMETDWFNPAINPPPFEEKLLLLVAGSRSNDCCRTYETYTEILTAYVQETGPGDAYDDETAHEEYISGDKTDFLDFQFDLQDENGGDLDWYSDSIIAWAYYPIDIAEAAIAIEQKRQGSEK